MNTLVIDSWALLEWLLGGPGAPKVRTFLDQADQQPLLMSWMNLGEVVYMLVRKRNQRASEQFLKGLYSLPIELVLPTAECFIRAARIKSLSRLSYADAFAVDLALQRQSAVVTGDPEIAALGFVKVKWVGP